LTTLPFCCIGAVARVLGDLPHLTNIPEIADTVCPHQLHTALTKCISLKKLELCEPMDIGLLIEVFCDCRTITELTLHYMYGDDWSGLSFLRRLTSLALLSCEFTSDGISSLGLSLENTKLASFSYSTHCFKCGDSLSYELQNCVAQNVPGVRLERL